MLRIRARSVSKSMISRKDVQHIARLARIELAPDEEEKFEKELSAILEFVAKLGEVGTATVEPLTGGTSLTNVMREDGASVPRNTETGPPLIAAAPRKRNGYVEVEAVFMRE